jgi:hypothetical protein
VTGGNDWPGEKVNFVRDRRPCCGDPFKLANVIDLCHYHRRMLVHSR